MLGAPAGFPVPGKGQQCPAQAEAFPHERDWSHDFQSRLFTQSAAAITESVAT